MANTPATPVTTLEAAPPPRSSGGKDDPLLDALHWFSLNHNKAISREALVAGLPLVNGRLSLQVLPRAAQRADLKVRVIDRDLSGLHPYLLPLILLLKDGQACILKRLIEGREAEILAPETGVSTTIPLADLQGLYTGRAVLVAPQRVLERAFEFAPPRPENWFWGLILGFRGIYGQIALAAVLINLFSLASPLFVMNVYDRVVPNRAISTLWALAIGVSVVILFDFLIRGLRGWFIDLAGRKVDVLLAQRLFEQVLGMRLSHRPTSSGTFANQLHEFESIREFLTSASLATLIDLPFVFLFIAAIWMIGGPIGLVPLVALPLLVVIALALDRPMRRAVEEAQISGAQKHAIAVEAVGGLEAIKINCCEGLVQGKWEAYTAQSASAALKSRGLSLLAINSTTLLQQLVYISIVIWGVFLVSDGLLSLGGLIACSILSGRAMSPFTGFANLLTRFHRFRVALRGLNKLIALPQERPAQARFLRRELLSGDIRLDRVSFHYPNQPGEALHDVNLVIRPGEKVGLVGPVGAGKSTLLRIILGLYQQDSGVVLMDGSDLRQIDPLDLRRNVYLMTQEPLLFYGTLRDNLALAAPWADDERILEVARKTGVDEFARRHPRGYDLMIGERGEGLSGGQKQAVTVARALLVDAPILLLDEPTSAMDRGAELRFEAVIREHVAAKTLVLSTHKPQLLTLVDRLIVMDKGCITADGPRDEILKAYTRPAAGVVRKSGEIVRQAGKS